MSTVKLFVYKTVKWEVTNVEFLSRDLPLNNCASMVKWKCLKLLYSSKGMCRIDSQLKKMISLKYFIFETPYTFFSIFSWHFIVLRILNFLSPMFSGINNHNFSFFGFSKQWLGNFAWKFIVCATKNKGELFFFFLKKTKN